MARTTLSHWARELLSRRVLLSGGTGPGWSGGSEGGRGRYRRLRRAHRAPISVLKSRATGRLLPQGEAALFFYNQWNPTAGLRGVRLVEIRHFLYLTARGDHLKKGDVIVDDTAA